MDKTVTARFGSVDMATFAAKTVSSHFDKIIGVRVNYQSPNIDNNKKPEFFSDFFSPIPSSAEYLSNAVFSQPKSAMEIQQDTDHSKRKRKITVRISANETSTGKIASALRNCGGWDVQVS